jgi:hypothetical protein
MVWKILRRKFTALKYEKGSPDRFRLNKKSITSEFSRKKVWLVVDENNRPLKIFETIKECKDFIANPDKYKTTKKFKKYTRDMYKKTREFFEKKNNNIKESLNY